jgi:hypothetical protein
MGFKGVENIIPAAANLLDIHRDELYLSTPRDAFS